MTISFRRLRIAGLTLLLVFAGPAHATDDQTRVAREMIEVLDAYTVYKMGQYDLAFERYLKLAEAGSRQGMLNVGNMYAQGQGVPQSHEKALYWYRRSAEAGDAISMAEVARAYDEGLGIAPDPEQAMIWYRRSAEKENPDAQWILGKALYDQGQEQEGLSWIRTAAQRGGQPTAQQFLAGLAEPQSRASRQPTPQQRDAVLATLALVDLAIQRRQASQILPALSENARIQVKLPNGAGWEQLGRDELVALWQATFDRAEAYRYQRLAPALQYEDGAIIARSRLREWFGSGSDITELEILETARLSFDEGVARIQHLQLDIRRAGD